MKLMNNHRASYLLILLLIFLITFVSACSNNEDIEADAENYPEEPIDAIIPWTAGGGSDIAFRGYMNYVSDELGENINMQNVTGGNGGVGWADAAAAEPDGYNMTLLTFDVLTNEVLGTSSVSYEDFDIVNMFTLQGVVLITHSDYGYEDVEDFLEAAREAKENGEQLTIGTNGDYGIWHQAGVLMENRTDTQGAFQYVPFGGSGDQTTEMLGKHLDAIITSPTASLPHIEEGTLQPLASMTEERLETLENVPTFTEIGYEVTYESFRALAFPKGVPEPILEKTREASQAAFENEEFQEWATESNIDQRYLNAEESIEFIENIYPTVEEVISEFDLDQ